MNGFVLVGGWPGSGKTTLSRALALNLGVPFLSKDAVKEGLMDALGTPSSVEESRLLGRAAVFAVLRAARGCQGAVIDSTWYPYSEPLVRALLGPLVKVSAVSQSKSLAIGTATESGTSDISTVSAQRRSCGASKWLRSASDR